jgi:hypothetical protein
MGKKQCLKSILGVFGIKTPLQESSRIPKKLNKINMRSSPIQPAGGTWLFL